MNREQLKYFKAGQNITIDHKYQDITIHGIVHIEFDEELDRLEVLDQSDNSLYMVTPNDMFWNIE